MVEQRIGGAEFLDLPCLASGNVLNLASDDMADLWRRDITVDDDNEPVPDNMSYEVTQPEYG